MKPRRGKKGVKGMEKIGQYFVQSLFQSLSNPRNKMFILFLEKYEQLNPIYMLQVEFIFTFIRSTSGLKYTSRYCST